MSSFMLTFVVVNLEGDRYYSILYFISNELNMPDLKIDPLGAFFNQRLLIEDMPINSSISTLFISV